MGKITMYAIPGSFEVECVNWKPIEEYKKDGTLVILLVCNGNNPNSHPLEDEVYSRTIGFNNYENDGEDEWHFAGWDWEQDVFREGHARVVKFFPLPDIPNETDIE